MKKIQSKNIGLYTPSTKHDYRIRAILKKEEVMSISSDGDLDYCYHCDDGEVTGFFIENMITGEDYDGEIYNSFDDALDEWLLIDY